ncbi:MAG: lysophospholipid acyltransferase family protein [Ignavibacteria bacterium]|jgi:KDO2-lipid IV(A) lauroyltransferase|nr:lysophospholipid acyltransferase family protein [Ignavibacteria bacterium]
MKLIVSGVGIFSSILSHSLRSIVAYFLSALMIAIDKKRYAHTKENIANAFPSLSEEKIREIATKSYHSLALTFLEIAAMPYWSVQKICSKISFENIELINQIHERNKGIILLSGHFGNWELLAFTAGILSSVPMTIVVKKQRVSAVAIMLEKLRTRVNNTVVDADNAAKEIVRDILRKRPVAFLVDQAGDPHKDIFVDFMGRPAVTHEAPAQLALRFGVPIIIGFARRNSDGTYSVRLEEIHFDDLSDTPEGRKQLTKRHVAALENIIYRYPEQWAWQHKRWKYEAP